MANDDSAGTGTAERPDPETPEKAQRRRFSAKYKLEVLQKADRCKAGTGELGALLRREGLYSSHLSKWREQRSRGQLKGLTPKKRGPKAASMKTESKEIARLRRENDRLSRELEKAQTIIELQKKLSKLLGLDSAGLSGAA